MAILVLTATVTKHEKENIEDAFLQQFFPSPEKKIRVWICGSGEQERPALCPTNVQSMEEEGHSPLLCPGIWNSLPLEVLHVPSILSIPEGA